MAKKKRPKRKARKARDEELIPIEESEWFQEMEAKRRHRMAELLFALRFAATASTGNVNLSQEEVDRIKAWAKHYAGMWVK